MVVKGPGWRRASGLEEHFRTKILPSALNATHRAAKHNSMHQSHRSHGTSILGAVAMVTSMCKLTEPTPTLSAISTYCENSFLQFQQLSAFGCVYLGMSLGMIPVQAYGGNHHNTATASKAHAYLPAWKCIDGRIHLTQIQNAAVQGKPLRFGYMSPNPRFWRCMWCTTMRRLRDVYFKPWFSFLSVALGFSPLTALRANGTAFACVFVYNILRPVITCK